jgi:hypothetical protein
MTTIDLDTLTLTSGSHDTRDQGVCFMEAVAWWAGQDHTDHPPCVSPILAAFGIRLNDYWNDADRQQLRPFIPRLPGTAGDGQDQTRGYLALDWFIRTYTVAWLDLAGLADEAISLQELDPITDMDTADAAGPVVRRARDKAAAAWAAAGAAAGAAARAAARDAALAAARATARDAAGAAARAAAWAAARDAALAEARDAARDAALAAAGAAARAKLASTVAILQVSMLDLFNRMIDARQETS